MIRSSKLTPPPPVPPRPSKSIVAEALAKSRRLSPIRALYATQPIKPVVPVRSAPPPPNPSVAQPQTPHNNRTIVYQSPTPPNVVKTSRIDVKLSTNPIDKVIDVLVNDCPKITTTIILKPSGDDNNNKKVQFDDKVNHEILISELQNMKQQQEQVLKRQRKVPLDLYDCDNESVNSGISGNSEGSRIQQSDWIEVANNGEEVRLSSCQIYIDTNRCGGSADESSKSSSFSSSSSRKLTQRVPSMSSLHGLPPLPKSLSGFNLLDNCTSGGGTPRGYRVPASPGPQTPSRAGSSRGTTPPTPGSGSGSGHVVYPPHPRLNGNGEIPRGRKITTLDTQLAVLRREMYGLRQLDLSLLSQLYSLNEAIQDFRQMLQEQEDSALSPNSPSPSPSSGDEGDEFYSPAPMRYKPAPPAPPLRRTSNSSSANSSEYGTV